MKKTALPLLLSLACTPSTEQATYQAEPTLTHTGSFEAQVSSDVITPDARVYRVETSDAIFACLPALIDCDGEVCSGIAAQSRAVHEQVERSLISDLGTIDPEELEGTHANISIERSNDVFRYHWDLDARTTDSLRIITPIIDRTEREDATATADCYLSRQMYQGNSREVVVRYKSLEMLWDKRSRDISIERSVILRESDEDYDELTGIFEKAEREIPKLRRIVCSSDWQSTDEECWDFTPIP